MVDMIADAKSAAKKQVEDILNENKTKLEEQIARKTDLIARKKGTWPDHAITKEENSVTDLQERVLDIDCMLSKKSTSHIQKFKQMQKRKASQIIEETRCKKRKLTNQGAPRKLDSDTEEFLAKAVEDKATYHGRRHDLVMYTNRRVKSRDLLNIANYRLLKQGKQMIKSATTVYNRCKPRNKRSYQASKHIGKGLMCFQKPPKAEDKDNENTHYQRAHVKNVKMAMFSEDAGSVKYFSLLHSLDDKHIYAPEQEKDLGVPGTPEYLP